MDNNQLMHRDNVMVELFKSVIKWVGFWAVLLSLINAIQTHDQRYNELVTSMVLAGISPVVARCTLKSTYFDSNECITIALLGDKK